MTGTITPCLLFAGNAEQAARFYTGIFDDASIGTISRYGDNMPMPAGTVLLVEFTLRGQPFQALNGGPDVRFNESVSLSIDCADQAELDRHWDALVADGGQPVQCGWLKDRFGVSWQIVPRMMSTLMRDGSADQIARMMAAMMDMVKLDIATLQAAFDGEVK